MTQVLVIEDEEVLARSIVRYLEKRGFTGHYVTTAAQGMEAYGRLRPALTLLDYRLGSDNGIDVLRRIRGGDPGAQVVMMTGHGDVSVAVQAMKAGARDFLTKPTALSSIASVAAEVIPLKMAVPAERRGSARILGRSSLINDLRRRIDRITDAAKQCAGSPPSVLITGETGCGKELIARALHDGGPRREGPFVSINCAALPSELIESELFGHEKGAFTDARETKTGLFELANGGVLFLDEVGELSAAAQAKLLRALEERTIRRLGGSEERAVDVWVIAATNLDLVNQVQQGAFRSDLMFRLQVLWVDAPPLRDRSGDILLLAGDFAEAVARKYGRKAPSFTSGARAKMISYHWPGNVRELRNVIERACLDAVDGSIDEEHIRYVTAKQPDLNGTGRETLQEIEIRTLRQALSQTGGNVSRAAALLGVTRDTLRYRMEKFGLQRGQ